MLDDKQTSQTTMPADDWLCPSCTKHILKVKNDGAKAQEVFVGAHVWSERAYGKYTGKTRDCSVANKGDGNHHYIYKSENGMGGEIIAGVFDTGLNPSKWLDKFSLGPGAEQEISLILDWNRQGIQRDWSLVAWGAGGLPVKVSHTDTTLTSDHLPQVNKAPRTAPAEL